MAPSLLYSANGRLCTMNIQFSAGFGPWNLARQSVYHELLDDDEEMRSIRTESDRAPSEGPEALQ